MSSDPGRTAVPLAAVVSAHPRWLCVHAMPESSLSVTVADVLTLGSAVLFSVYGRLGIGKLPVKTKCKNEMITTAE